ncbi:MAG TPA: hypothetical protein VE913_20775 [Longimicrobium sp.]|nr:hypothetical protein [Longimicrobium sp.]
MKLAGFLAACILGRCVDAPPGSEAPSLAGRWEVTLRAGRLPLPIPTSAPTARVVLTMAPDARPLGTCGFGGDAPCADSTKQIADAAVGTFEIRAEKGFPRVHASGEAHLAVTAGGVLHFVLGPCCDAGAISGKGVAGVMRGEWHQESLGDAPRGRYRITRLGDPPAAPR